MRNVSGRSCRENRNTRYVFSNVFFFLNRAVYEVMWQNIIERGRPQMTIWRMLIACCIPEVTNTHTGCVILIAFPLRQRSNESASMLSYTYIVCIVAYGNAAGPWLRIQRPILDALLVYPLSEVSNRNYVFVQTVFSCAVHCSAVAFFSCDEENEWFEERCILCNTCRFGYVPTWWDLNFPKGKDYSWYSLRTSPRSISQQQGRYATSRQSGDIALDIAGEDQMSTLYTTKDNRTPVAVLWLTYPFSGW